MGPIPAATAARPPTGMPAADVEAVNRILMTGGDAETAEELRRRYPRLDLTTWSKENRLQF